ncbi:nuclear pore complex protein Nup133-like [Gigantopelta aegis]|uniref:nuclear pore complex protein Nup133-like n=1 Tax=Gigantopelta aegis TaxID=1735272 RepID=UPI001B887C19|nr:nuclear pore complex protein Nup133-like [Gigantopelta aegis]
MKVYQKHTFAGNFIIMFTPRGLTTKARGSPFTPSSTQSKRISNLFTPQSRRPSLSQFTGGRSQISANRSQSSQLLDDSSLHRVDNYGVSLPVLITEALTLADRSTEITVCFDPSGWAWMVGGRKLFVWRYKPTVTTRGVQCKELMLPSSDLAHSAERVCIIPNIGDSQMASCVAVSPEGVVRYWPNIAYESSTAEISAELKGEECACVVNFEPFGVLLATTTSSLILLLTAPGQNTISCQPLKSSQGMFAGIGRRMSSFIFGASPLQTTGATLQALVPGFVDEDSRPFFVLSGTVLQKWEISEECPEKLLYQVDIGRLFRDALARKVWNQDSVQMAQLRTWLLDMKITRNGVMILGCGVNLESTSVVHYAVALLSTSESEPASSLDMFTVLDNTEHYQEEHENYFLGYHLLVPDINSLVAYIYDKHNIFIVSVSESNPTDTIELPSGDQLLGAGNSDKTAVFFSNSRGLFCVSSSAKTEQSILDESDQAALARTEVSSLVTSHSKVAEMSVSDDRYTRLKAAFINSLSGHLQDAQTAVENLFPSLCDESEAHTDMDELVVALSVDLIDDYPTSDPRWAESLRQDAAFSSSLIIQQQLRDKEKAHDYLISFLKKLDLWDRLCGVVMRETVMSTRLFLCEHAEKLQAAIALRELHSEHAAVIDNCIQAVLETERDAQIPSGLTPQDVFYREVSRISEIVSALIDYEVDRLSSDLPPRQRVILVSITNNILEGVLSSALQYRQCKAAVFQSEADELSDFEYIPWTSSGGSKGIRTLISKQFNITLESGVPEAKNVEGRGVLFEQVLRMADLLLDGYSCQLESLRQNPEKSEQYRQLNKKYEQERSKLISPLLDYEQYERAASLAEKYFDFNALIQICEVTNNEERLQRYITQFADRGFSKFLFDWYMKEGKRGRLLCQPGIQSEELQTFLNSDNNKYLSWLHDINSDNYLGAHETLMQLQEEETTFLAKKKTLLSLCKLAALAVDNYDIDLTDNIEVTNDALNLVLHQEQVPPDVFRNIGVNPENMRVFSPKELIELYIGDENHSANEYHFKIALDLLHYVDKDDPSSNYDQLKIHIWTRAILRDNWSQMSTSDPMESNRQTVFFKMVDLAHSEGEAIGEILPDVNVLLASEELGPLRDNANFQFLLKAGYEHIQRILS